MKCFFYNNIKTDLLALFFSILDIFRNTKRHFVLFIFQNKTKCLILMIGIWFALYTSNQF